VKRYRYTVLIPVEMTLDDPKQLKDAIRSVRSHGAFPETEHYGIDCYSWRTRHDLARLKNVKEARRD